MTAGATRVLARVLRSPGRGLPGTPGAGDALYQRPSPAGGRTAEGGADRRRWVLGPQERLELDTWAAALPAAWWAACTRVEEVRLEVDVASGGGVVRLLRTEADGTAREVGRRELAPGRSAAIAALTGPSDSGWLYCVLDAGPDGLDVSRLEWTAADALVVSPVTVAVTTYDRVDDVQALLRDLDDEALTPLVAEVVVVDQGRDRVLDHVDAQADRAVPLRVLEQPNLGGAGGFARGALAALDSGSSGVLFLDDDIRIDAESVRRLVVAAAACTRPTLLGGAMLSTTDPTRLHALGESVHRPRFWWGPAPGTEAGLDLAPGLSAAAWLHRRPATDYAGWWTCLIPAEVLRAHGLPAPFFLKWDDVELALRAGRAGVPSTTWPGAWSWHVPWTGKTGETDWTAYFLLRNRLATALAHAPGRGTLPLECLALVARQVLRRDPVPAALRLLALRDVLSGPGWMASDQQDARSAVLARVPARTRGWRLTSLGEAALLSARLLLGWPALARRYRARLPDASSVEAWRARLGPGPR